MALDGVLQVYRSTEANLNAIASTGSSGALAWTTDTNELYMGPAGIGAGSSWQAISRDVSTFTVTSQAAQLALAEAKLGDFCVRTDNDLTYMLTTWPSSVFTNWILVEIIDGSGGGYLPDQAGHAGQLLMTDGQSASWTAFVDGGTY